MSEQPAPMSAEKLKWKLWGLLTKWPSVCPAKAHTLFFYDRVDPRIDAGCRRDCAANDVCWCGKLRAPRGSV